MKLNLLAADEFSETREIISLLDNNRERYSRVIANVMLVIQSVVTMFDESLVLMRSNLKMHHVPLIAAIPIVAANAFQCHDQHRLERKKGIRSANPKKKKV